MGERPERLDLARLVRTTSNEHRSIFQQARLDLEADVPEVPVWGRDGAIVNSCNNPRRPRPCRGGR
jgi:hypothetical protein